MSNNLNLQNKKLELIQWISTVEDPSIIEKMVALRNDEMPDWWDSLSEPEKKSIETGIQDAEQGKLNSHAKAKSLYEKWL